MLDLIYVDVMAVALDFLEMIFVSLNINGLSHPIQTFSYALRFRLELVVLNQLMAVAVRGLYKESFEEKQYHHPSTSGDTCWERPIQFKGSQPPQWSENQKEGEKDSTEIHIPRPQATDQERGSNDPIQISMRSPSLSRDRRRSHGLAYQPEATRHHSRDRDLSMSNDEKNPPLTQSNGNSSAEINLPLQSPADIGIAIVLTATLG